MSSTTRASKKKTADPATEDILLQLAFHNSAQANIIVIVKTGEIVVANSAACKLLAYSKKALLTRNRSDIFDVKDPEFKKMLKQRKAEGRSAATVTAIKKNGRKFACEITSAVFTDKDGVDKSITSMALISEKMQDETRSHPSVSSDWKKHAGVTSYDVMWDWDLVTGMVYIGESSREVFGYKFKNNTSLFSDLKKYFILKENISLEENLKTALASTAKSWSDSYKLKRQDGSIAAVNSRGAIVRDDNGKAIRMIGATQDVTLMQELETKLEQQATETEQDNDNMFHLAAKLSYDGIWDWNIQTNEFFLGEGFEKIFGYTFPHPSKEGFHWSSFLHPDDKQAVEKSLWAALDSSAMSWERAYRFIKADGCESNVFCRASIIRDENGKACRMIGAIHDLSQQKELEVKLEQEIASTGRRMSEYSESFRLMFNSSSDILYDIDLATDEIILSDGYYKEFGYPITPHMKAADVWGVHLHPDDKNSLLEDYYRMLSSKESGWKYNYRFIKADGSIADILSSRIILRDEKGVAYRMIGSMQNVSKQKALEEKLAQVIKLKEQEIADAMRDAKEAERSDLGKELHDNVNQLLSVSRLYLVMAKQGGPEAEMHLSHSSEYTMSAIEAIRKLTKGLVADSIEHFGLIDAIKKLAVDTMEVSDLIITCSLDPFIENRVNAKFKLNVHRILQEQLNNIQKHAQAKTVTVNFSQNKKSVILSIADDGVGFDTTIKRKGIGVDNIISRASSFGGTAEFVSSPGNGCVLNVVFRMTEEAVEEEAEG